MQDNLETEAASDDDNKPSPTRAELKEQVLQAAVKKERNKQRQQELREELSKLIDLLNTTSHSFEALHQVSVYSTQIAGLHQLQRGLQALMDSELAPLFYPGLLPPQIDRVFLAEKKMFKYWEITQRAFEDHLKTYPGSQIRTLADILTHAFEELKRHLTPETCRTKSLKFQVGYVLKEIVAKFCNIINLDEDDLPNTLMRRLCFCMEYLAIYCHHGSVSRTYMDKLPKKFLRVQDVDFSPQRQDRLVN